MPYFNSECALQLLMILKFFGAYEKFARLYGSFPFSKSNLGNEHVRDFQLLILIVIYYHTLAPIQNISILTNCYL